MADDSILPRLPDLACSMRGLAGLVEIPATSGRGLIDWVHAQGFRAIALDATHPDTRPRDLDRSARRDLAASLRRMRLTLAGVDVLVPAAHFASGEHVDRALAAALGAIELARDLAALAGSAEPVVCVALPDEPREGVVSALKSASEEQGVRVATHRRSAHAHERSVDIDALVDAGVDPAGEIAKGCAQVRWGGPRADQRVNIGLAAGAFGMLGGSSCVLDLSHGRSPVRTAERALAAWENASTPFDPN